MTTKRKLRRLDQTLQNCRTLLILLHNYPDPDALASGMLLAHLVRKRYRIRTRLVYGGLITRAENRTMVQLLKVKLRHANEVRFPRYRHIAMVDTQPGFGNHSLPDTIRPTIVLDHHPQSEKQPARFTDIRPDYAATTTILLEYLKEAELELTVDLATAAAYAIRSETQEFGREASRRDIKTYAAVYLKANKIKLSRINRPKLPRDYFQLLLHALQSARVFRHIAHVHLGEVASPEFVSQIADLLLRHERITWALATGRFENTLFVSLRCSHAHANAGGTLKRIVGKRGSAGGHTMMAGGSLTLDDPTAERWQELETYVVTRLLSRLHYNKSAEWKPMLDVVNSGNLESVEENGGH